MCGADELESRVVSAIRSSWRLTVTQAVATCRTSFALVKQREHCGSSTPCAVGRHAAEVVADETDGFLLVRSRPRSPDNGVTSPASVDPSCTSIHAESRLADFTDRDMSWQMVLRPFSIIDRFNY